MNIVNKIETLLENQIDTLAKLEAITNNMLDGSIDDITHLVEERGKLLKHAAETKDEIRKTADGNEDILSIINCTCDISKLSCELNDVFQHVLKINLSVNRIKTLDSEILARIEGERDSVLNKLESLNSSSNSVAGNYKRATETLFPHPTIADSLNIRTV